MKNISLWLCAAVMFCAFSSAQSTESVLYSFGGAPDGGYPSGGLLFDAPGNVYGTTVLGGNHCLSQQGCGTVYELSPSLDGYSETILYSFCTTDDPYTCPDGAEPWGGLVSDSSGNLYGATSLGGRGYGTVFELSPPIVQGGAWTESVLWEFGNTKGDGRGPFQGKLNWDTAGNLYGTTSAGGAYRRGTVFELSPKPGGGWAEAVLFSFSGADGADPFYGVAIDAAGNLYGTTNGGGIKSSHSYCQDGCGTVFELMPSANGWTEQLLYRPTGAGGARPNSNISADASGNLYGTLEYGGDQGQCYAQSGCGGVFKLVPKAGGGGTRYSFLFNGQNGGNPWAGVLVDGDAVFGTTSWGDNVFEIKGRTESVLYQFCSQPNCTDGTEPLAGALVSRDGVLYGVTAAGGEFNNGVVYSVTK
jgi:uncharacterized repeat protein (TIGR03803 family)